MTQTTATLYKAAAQADERFQSAVVAQFGKRNAGDMRYQSSKHNAETAAARDAFQSASEAWRQAVRSKCDCQTTQVFGEAIHELTCALFDGKPLCQAS